MSADETGPVERLLALAPPGRVAAALDLQRRVAAPRLRVLVAGEAKRGKSTLLNRLVGADLLPTGAVPVTAVATAVLPTGSGDGHLDVEFLDLRTQRLPLGDLAGLVTEALNPGNAAGVREVRASVPTQWLPSTVELVDTPGTGSVWQHNTEAATAAFASLDAVIVVLTADPPASQADRDLLVALQQQALATFVFVNKLDQVHGADRDDVVAFTRQVCVGAGLGPERVWFGSARHADEGFDAFRRVFGDYLELRAVTDAWRALAGHADRLLQSLLGDAELELGVLDAMHSEGEHRVRDLAGRVQAIRGDAERLDADCTATEIALHNQLNAAADRLRASVVAEVTSTLTADHANVHQGRQLVEALTSPAVATWHAQQHDLIEARLAGLRRVVADRVAAQLSQLSADALSLLGVDLGTSAPDFILPAQAGPVFDYQAGPRWEAPGASLLREHAPGAGRRARARLLTDAPQLVDRQVGRARADLQHTVEEGVRWLRRRLVVEHSERLDELVEIVSRAQLAVRARSAETEVRRRELVDRVRQLRAIGPELGVPEPALGVRRER